MLKNILGTSKTDHQELHVVFANIPKTALVATLNTYDFMPNRCRSQFWVCLPKFWGSKIGLLVWEDRDRDKTTVLKSKGDTGIWYRFLNVFSY
jgi:hypothetical protein